MGEIEKRKVWMGLLARAPAARLAALWQGFGLEPEHTLLRPPEIGAVMVRGRAGATGAPFNLGEMTVTRCSTRLACGAVGHGYVQGRDKTHARTAALIDALMQTPCADALSAAVLDPLAAELDLARSRRAARAAATKVDFFTLVRGED
jgi:alpha-D-ribose 1-methylphosphonate 5-triphosphate synthase subunit PhnG